MKKIFILLLCFIIASNVKAQCTAPSFTVDLRGAIDTTAIIENKTRAGVCCGSSNCVTFLVYSNSSSDLIGFDVTNPSPSGSAYYQVNCGTPVSIGTPLCIKGLVSPFTITYCKPGGDSPDYVISASKAVHGSNDITMQKTGCKDTLFVNNVNLSTITWTSIYPGVQGAYNSYLSCTAGCNSSIVTPGPNPPPYVDFKVSGLPVVACGGSTSDTIRVYFVDVPTGTITPVNPVICATSGSSLTLTANISGGALPYKYDWSNVAGTNNSYTTSVSAAGTYSVIISDKTKCPSITLTKVIGTIPVTTFSYPATYYCKGDPNPTPVFGGSSQPGAFSATPVGLSFVSISTGVINLMASNSGTYVVTNTVAPSGACSGSSSTTTVIIHPFPSMTSASTATICGGNMVNIPLTSSIGSDFTWLASDNANTTGESTTTQTASSLINTLVNTGTTNEIVVYTVTPISTLAGSCAGNQQIVNVTVRPKDDASFNYPSSTNCKTGVNPVATITGLNGGTFSTGTGLVFLNSAGTIDLSASTIGSYTVTYTTNGICPNSQDFPINITTAPMAAFNYSASPYCQNETNPLPTFSAGASGGTFSSSAGLVFANNLTGEIDLAASTPGTYTVMNTIAPSGLCGTSTATAVVTITQLQEAGFSYTASPICQNSTNPLPVFTTNGVAGTFASSSGLTIDSGTGLVDLLGSTPGSYTVTNTLAAIGGCPVVIAENNITITELPISAFNYSASPFCSNSVNSLPSFTGGGVAGTFNASSVYLDIDASTGLIKISNSQPGDYIVSNTIAAANGCPAVASSASVTITKLPDAAIVFSGPYCTSSANPTPTLSIDGTNGNYASDPTGLNLDANSGTIDLASSTAGTYTVTNTVSAANGCPAVTGSSAVTITKLPSATFDYPSTPYCIDGSNPSPAYIGEGAAGTFSATPALSINGSNGQVDLAGCSAGTYTVTNVITASNGCPDVAANAIVTINPIPTASAGADATICADQSYTLSGGVGGAASTLVWTTSGSGVFSNSSSATSLYTPSAFDISKGSVVLTITSDDPNGPCSFATDAMTLTINPTPTVSAGSTNTLTCSNKTLVLTGSGGGTYTWEGPGIVSGAGTSNPVINEPGTYSLVVISSLNCSSDISTVVIFQDTVSPIVMAANSGSLSCTTLAVNASVSTSASPVSYNWSGSGIISAGNISTITVNQGGTYNYTVTNTFNNCITVGSLSIVQNTVAPTVLIGSPSVTTTCANPTAQLNIVSTPSVDVTYSWTAPSTGSLNNYAISNPVASGSGVFTVVVTNNISGCVSSSVSQSTIEVIPDIGIPTTILSASSASITCANPNPSVTVTSNIGNVSYNWLPAAGIVPGTENTASPSFIAAGTYSAIVTNTNSGCATFITNNVVTVVLDNAIPVVSLTGSVNNGTITCSTSTVIATSSVTPANDISYTWTSATGAGISGPSNQASATFTASGNYTLAVTNTVTGCTSVLDASSIFTVFVDTISPIANFKFVTGCSKDSVKFIDQSSISTGSITDWTWNFGDGNNSLIQNPANNYSQVSSYTVSLQVRAANGCMNAANGVVSLIPPVLADFVPGGGDFLINQPIAFTNQSSGSTNYIWSFGDGTTTSSTDPTHAFSSLGSYSVMLVASNSIGCKDSISVNVNVKPAGYAIPGGFTPNGDGMNDGFSVLGGPFSSYELRVFNAWGNEIFVTNSQNDKWDGSYKDTQQPAGTYIYIFNGKIVDGEDLKLKGEVHIIR
ncbi:MAG: C-terminal target protein [Bacteroidetes bacterium]|jgi:gliding motility-associated-like protein|nr:C-terminal target protein [Bacteroidota bacterium]MDF2450889.1 C-terminal target protein [Bacteroidota bacterium]